MNWNLASLKIGALALVAMSTLIGASAPAYSDTTSYLIHFTQGNVDIRSGPYSYDDPIDHTKFMIKRRSIAR
jgi:hypothetical protein